MICIKKWQRFLKWLLFLLVLFVLWQVLQNILSMEYEDDYYHSRSDKKSFDHWGLNNDDISWLPGLIKSRSDELPIVVVEEHYEVLKYWFQAAEVGIISKSRNILIHIDGHVDGAIPYDTETLPWFRFPASREEIHNMMQRNDMFIVAAVLTGLIEHVVWVWPRWDVPNHDSDWNHIIFDIHLGYIKLQDETIINGHRNDLCACWKQRNLTEISRRNKLTEGVWHCHRRNFTQLEAQDGPRILKDQCLFQSEAVLEIMSESKASTQLQKMYPASVSAGVILDIDEDFFGCWSDMFSFQKTETPQKSMELLTELVSDILCVESAAEEQLADHFYTALINLVITLKSQSCESQGAGRPCKTNVEISNFIIENVQNLLNFLIHQGYEHLLCHKELKLRGLFMQSMMQLLLNFSIKELKLLSEIGICFEVSPSSRYFAMNGRLHVCYGENTPKRSEVSFHYPSTKEMSSQNVTLRKVVSSVFRKPDIITVCRSVRDGYTPKKLQTIIENNILKTISNLYRSAQISKVHFDNNLLGGKEGWSNRSMEWSNRLLQYLSVDKFRDWVIQK